MSRGAKSWGNFWCFLLNFQRYSLTFLLSLVVLFDPLGTTPRMRGLEIGQKVGTTQQDANRAAAERASQEGLQLYQQGTAESLRQAIFKWQEALQLWQQLNDKAKQALTLTGIGLVYSDLGDKQKALVYYNQALPLIRAVGDRSGEATTLNNIGLVYSDLGDKQKALVYYNQALPLIRAVGDRRGEARTITCAVGDRSGEATILYTIALAERDKGNFQQALTQIQAAVNIIEDLRSKVANQELRTSYFASVQGYYQFYIDLLMQLHKNDPSHGYDAEALHISEKSRARILTELLTEAHADIRKGVDPALLAAEQRLQQLIDSNTKRLHELSNKRNTDAEIAKLKQVVEHQLSQQQELETKIRIASPKYAALKYPQPLTLPQIQQQLDKNTLLLEYSLGSEHSYLWAVTPNSVDTYELPGKKQIENAAIEFSNNLQLPYGSLGRNKLSQMLLAPVASKLGKKRLVIVADDVLQTIPFTALSDITPNKGASAQGKYQPLILQHEIVNLPSATTIATQRLELTGRQSAPKTLAILADPVFDANDPRVTGKPDTIAPNLNLSSQIKQSDLKRAARSFKRSNLIRLKWTRTEAIAILKLVTAADSLHAFDFDANYNWVTSKKLSQYRYIHLATHGFANLNENPELSGLVLSLVDKQGLPTPQGYLQLGDIFNLDLPADLVVLSACDTGLGKDIQGEGLVGLTRGLMYAGAQRVAVSLWEVDDEATALLMQEFYQQMLHKHKSPTVALREAQLKLLHHPKWNKPLYWAAFTLQGEWR